jgi:putative IMPACT (imprinted ancient) family translation regulator
LGNQGDKWRANDDGEPSGTGGRPIIGQIRSYGLTNIIIVVSRYFGGTLLGVSGLINAYRAAAASALENAEIIEHIVMDTYELTFPYKSMNDVMTIIKEENIIRSEHSFELECSVKISFRSSSGKKILDRLSRIAGLKFQFIETG